MKRPFVFLICPLMIGIIITYYSTLSINSLYICLIIVAVLLFISLVLRRGYPLCLFAVFIIIGAIVAFININANVLLTLNGESVLVEAVVKEQIKVEKNYQKLLLRTDLIKNDQKIYEVDEKMILHLTGDSKSIKIGDKISIEGSLEDVKQNTNPFLFNYKLYLNSQDIFSTITVHLTSIKVISEDNLSFSEKTAMSFKNNVTKILDTSLNKENSDIMKSIILGDSSYLEGDLQDRFRSLGIGHLLAVSGLHIGIIYGFLLLTLGVLRIEKRISVILSLVIVWVYGYMIGLPPSVLRASIMFSFLSIGQLIYRRYDSINILALAATILLLFNPLWMFSIAFQFSFTATASLILFTPKVNHFFVEHDFKAIAKVISPLIAVQLGTLPIMIYYFNSYSILALLTNILVVPIISLCLIMTFVLLMIYLIYIKLALVLGLILDIILFFCKGAIDIFFSLPNQIMNISSPSIIGIVFYYLMLLAIFRIIRVKSVRKYLMNDLAKIVAIYAIMLSLSIGYGTLVHDHSIVEFIDVGQGDCALIRTKEGNFLVDTGGTIFGDYDVGSSVVLPYLIKSGAKDLEGVFISHFHEDHAEGLLSLIGNVNIKRLFIPYNRPENELYNDIMKKLEDTDVDIIELTKGDEIAIGENKKISVIFPEKRLESTFRDNENNLSLVLLFDIYNKKILFTGDIEKPSEALLISDPLINDIDVIKIPHHGSNTSSTEKLIDYTKPEIGIVQVGKNNYGHPNKEVLDRYISRNIGLYRNDRDGLIAIRLDKDSMKISPYLKEKLTILEFLYGNKVIIAKLMITLCIWSYILKVYNRYNTDKRCLNEL